MSCSSNVAPSSQNEGMSEFIPKFGAMKFQHFKTNEDLRGLSNVLTEWRFFIPSGVVIGKVIVIPVFVK